MFQTDVIWYLCVPRSICDNKECSQWVRFSFRSAPVERNVIYRRLRLPLEHSRFLDLFEHIRMFRTWVVRFQRFTAGLPFVARTSQLFHSKLLRKVPCFTHIISGTHDACRSKCVSRVFKGALARRLSIQEELYKSFSVCSAPSWNFLICPFFWFAAGWFETLFGTF